MARVVIQKAVIFQRKILIVPNKIDIFHKFIGQRWKKRIYIFQDKRSPDLKRQKGKQSTK